MRKTFFTFVALCSFALMAQGPSGQLTIALVMTPQDLRDTGVATLSSPQRHALDDWLNRYTQRVVQVAVRQAMTNRSGSMAASNCSPSVESTVSGEFHGWEGETVFKLDNGQIWQQAEYDYMYSYSYRPGVTIYETSGGCRMKVEGEEETILVRRIK